ncbi:MAG: hypothetical protein ABIA83_02695 [Patescibacteria group bacterium]
MNSKSNPTSPVAVLFTQNDGVVGVYPNPIGPLAHLYQEVEVEVRGQKLQRPRMWVFGAHVPETLLGAHGRFEDWKVLKLLMRENGVSYGDRSTGEHVPCYPDYRDGAYMWHPSDAAQLRTDSPLAIFRR